MRKKWKYVIKIVNNLIITSRPIKTALATH